MVPRVAVRFVVRNRAVQRRVAARDPIADVRFAVREHPARRRRSAQRGRRQRFGARASRRNHRVVLESRRDQESGRAAARVRQERKRPHERVVETRVFVLVFVDCLLD